MKQPDTMKITVRNVRRTLAAGISLRARIEGVTRETLLLSLLEKEFSQEEQEITRLEHNALARYHPD